MKKVNSKKALLIKLLINFIISLSLFFFIFFVRFKVDHYIVDSFTLTGVVLLLLTSLRFVISEGVFNSIEWAFKKFSDFFRRMPKYNYKYHEFIAIKEEKNKPLLWPTFLIGAIYLTIGLIMIICIS